MLWRNGGEARGLPSAARYRQSVLNGSSGRRRQMCVGPAHSHESQMEVLWTRLAQAPDFV